MQNYRPGTDCLHAGYVPESGEPRNIPIIQSTTFRYGSSAAMGALFDLEAAGYFYTRLQNPTSDRVAAKICALEGGSAAMLTSSGQAANFFALFNICSAGDHVVSSTTIYGGTFNLFAVTMKRMGIDFTFVSPDCLSILTINSLSLVMSCSLSTSRRSRIFNVSSYFSNACVNL